MFTGALIAIVTPFRNGKVDERAFGDLIEWQIANGTSGIVPCGTTGESATLSHQEHHRVIELTVEVVNGASPSLPGPVPTARQKRCPSQNTPSRQGPMGRCSLLPITTNRRKRACIDITK